ncbi:MAG: DUF488 family protein [Myxococcales bacterium]|nr:DUF488 family protein [Myxococcales bacterium]
MPFTVKRIRDDKARGDGRRVLVERLWPRGVSKQDAALDAWLKDVAPTTALRKWFGHEPARWEAFRRRYFAELETREEAAAAVAELRRLGRRGRVTLLFSSREERLNNAVALKDHLDQLEG